MQLCVMYWLLAEYVLHHFFIKTEYNLITIVEALKILHIFIFEMSDLGYKIRVKCRYGVIFHKKSIFFLSYRKNE